MAAPHSPSPSHSPILFAHRGGCAHGRENSLSTFQLALAKGIAGLESDVHLSADNRCILSHDPSIWQGLRRRKIAKRNRAQLPERLADLGQLYDSLGSNFELSLDIKGKDTAPANAAAEAVVRTARDQEQRNGQPALSRLWLCHPNWELLADWRTRWPELKLVNSTRTKQLDQGAERRAAQLSEAGINALNMPNFDWSQGNVALAHRFGILAFGWDAHLSRVIAELIGYGVDGIYGDDVDALLEVVGTGAVAGAEATNPIENRNPPTAKSAGTHGQ